MAAPAGPESYSKPQDIQCELRMKVRKDSDYFRIFGYGAIISLVLTFIIPFFLLLFFLCLALAGMFGLIILVAGEHERLFRNIDKIYITTSGFALVSREGRIEYAVPFSTITGVRYGYREHAISAALNMGARVPVFIQFDLASGKKFTIMIDEIMDEDQQKIASFLPGFSRMFPVY